MKPKSKIKFYRLLKEHSGTWSGSNRADIHTISQIAFHIKRESWQEDTNYLNFIEDFYNQVSSPEGLKNFIFEKIKETVDNQSLIESFQIGDTGYCKYPDIQSFLQDLNCKNTIKEIKKYWVRACKSNSWDKYYDACYTSLKDPKDEWDTIYDDHGIEVWIYPKYEKELIALGYKEKIDDPNKDFEQCTTGEFQRREYIDSKSDVLVFWHSLPYGWMDWMVDYEYSEGDDQVLSLPKAKQISELLGLKEEWIKSFGYGS